MESRSWKEEKCMVHEISSSVCKRKKIRSSFLCSLTQTARFDEGLLQFNQSTEADIRLSNKMCWNYRLKNR